MVQTANAVSAGESRLVSSQKPRTMICGKVMSTCLLSRDDVTCALMITYNAEEDAFQHNFPTNSKILEPFRLDPLCFVEQFKYDLEKHNSYNGADDENTEEHVTSEEDVRDFDLADEAHSFYALHSQVL